MHAGRRECGGREADAQSALTAQIESVMTLFPGDLFHRNVMFHFPCC
jgi:hypothetical protein